MLTDNTIRTAIGFLMWPGMLSYTEVYEFANFFAREIANSKGKTTNEKENKLKNE